MNPAHRTGAHGAAVYYGDPAAPHVLRVFPELRDPGRRRMADGLLGTFRAGADDGRLVVRFHFAAAPDDTVGGRGARRTARDGPPGREGEGPGGRVTDPPARPLRSVCGAGTPGFECG
ncbi:hypothetical protein [Streptomyces sp. CC208A]|uniref:hypothetical protein n=1 Tax=Streptomyces sp. CC208A TaxID=3044573 RepID=UPI0024A911CA|nr:hypothetical protein [Streptomyces sp. CC208A]